MQNATTTLENYLEISFKVKNTPTVQSSHSLLDIYPREIYIYIHKKSSIECLQ